MIDVIEYLNQSGFTNLIRIFLIIGGLLSLAIFFLAIWFFIKISHRIFKTREHPDRIIDRKRVFKKV